MWKGNVVLDLNPTNIDYPKPNSVEYVVMKFACDRAK